MCMGGEEDMESDWFQKRPGFQNRRPRRRRERASRGGGSRAVTISRYDHPKGQMSDLSIDFGSLASSSFQNVENSPFQRPYDKTSLMTTEEHMDQQILKQAEIRWSSPCLIAKLMGLDEQPSVQGHHKQKMTTNGDFQEKSAVSLKERCPLREEHSTWISTAELQRSQGVCEVTAIPKVMGDKKPCNKSLTAAKQNKVNIAKQNKLDISFLGIKVMDAKKFPRDKPFKISKGSSDGLGDQNCPQHHCVEAFEEPNFSFRKYFQHLKWLTATHLTNKFSNFRSSKVAEIESSKVWCPPVSKTGKSTNLQNAAMRTFRSPITAIVRDSHKEHSDYLMHKQSKVHPECNNSAHIHPKQIVVLKPTVDKASNKGSSALLRVPKNIQSANRRLNNQARFQEPHIRQRDWPKLSPIHNTKGPKEIARHVTEQLKESITRNEEFVPVFNIDERSCSLGDTNGLCYSESFWSPSNHCNDWNIVHTSSLSYSTLVGREFQKDLRGIFKMTNHYKKENGCAKVTNTLAEMFDLSDMEAKNTTAQIFSVPHSVDIDKLMKTDEELTQRSVADETIKNPELCSLHDKQEPSVHTKVDYKLVTPVSAKDFLQPVSALKLLMRKDDSGSSESTTGDLLELHTKTSSLQSADPCAKTTVVTSVNGKDGEEYQSLLSSYLEDEFMDDEERDYSYLLDILIVSGIHGAKQERLSNACYSSEYPVNPGTFEVLEKKYSKPAVWSRSERKLMFDLTNLTLAEILAPCMNPHPWVKTARRIGPMWGSEGLLEKTWLVLVERRIEHNIRKAVDLEWLSSGDHVDEIGRLIEIMLMEKLFEELFIELLTECNNIKIDEVEREIRIQRMSQLLQAKI